VTGLLLSFAILLGVVAYLGEWAILFGVAMLLAAQAVLLLGVAYLEEGATLLGVACLLASVAILVARVSLLRRGVNLLGVVGLLGGGLPPCFRAGVPPTVGYPARGVSPADRSGGPRGGHGCSGRPPMEHASPPPLHRQPLEKTHQTGLVDLSSLSRYDAGPAV